MGLVPKPGSECEVEGVKPETVSMQTVYCRVECSSANTQFMEFTQSVPEKCRLEVNVNK